MATSRASGSAQMREWTRAFPAQLRSGFAAGRALEFRWPRGVDRSVVVGMGGSAIGADLLRSLTDAETDLLVQPVREPTLPRWVGPSTLAVAVSYSGDTWETLAAFDVAGRRGAPRVAVSSGGRLQQLARAEGVPHLMVPPGLQPRAALGSLLGGLLGLFDPAFPASNRDRLDRASKVLLMGADELGGAAGPPTRLAARIRGRLPWICSSEELAPVARRWATQIEENAKRLAHWDALPESLHNVLVAWDALTRREAERYFVVRLQGAGDDQALRDRFEYLSKLLAGRKVPVATVRFEASDRLERTLSAIQWGDYLSLALAELGGVDPFPVEAIQRMKHRLEKDHKSRNTIDDR
ncbi:MAG: bifunctional phosphoglucose/phosphomannose isomerase [Thermoplasmata archaeon]|nr:bifunctional phosphoglucose/phosphomannose isomerase [Thermoplasmata archaeon]